MIVEAIPSDTELLTKIALASKAFWKYTQEQLDGWIDELAITSAYLSKTSAFVYKVNGTIIPQNI